MTPERRQHRTPVVLLPLDGTAESCAAMPVARSLAAIARATLHIAYVTPQPMPIEQTRRHLALSEKQLVGTVLDTVTGAPAEGIVRLAVERHSLVIVMAMHDGHPGVESGLGSVAEGVLRNSPCPILLVPPYRPAHWHMQRILLPQDGTPEAAAIIESAARLAARVPAELLLLHVGGIPGAAEPGTIKVPTYMDQPHHEWPQWTREFVERVRGLGHLPRELKLRLFVARGDAGDEIVKAATAHAVDLIIMPWHGSLAPQRAVALKAVIRGGVSPVLILSFAAGADLHIV